MLSGNTWYADLLGGPVCLRQSQPPRSLVIRYRGGFFDNDDDFCSALVDGAFTKTLVVSMIRWMLL